MVIESLLPALKDRPWFKAGDIYLPWRTSTTPHEADWTSSTRSRRPAASKSVAGRIGRTRIVSSSSWCDRGIRRHGEPGWPANPTLTVLGRRR